MGTSEFYTQLLAAQKVKPKCLINDLVNEQVYLLCIELHNSSNQIQVKVKKADKTKTNSAEIIFDMKINVLKLEEKC